MSLKDTLSQASQQLTQQQDPAQSENNFNDDLVSQSSFAPSGIHSNMDAVSVS
jgi:hypothetical protein